MTAIEALRRELKWVTKEHQAWSKDKEMFSDVDHNEYAARIASYGIVMDRLKRQIKKLEKEAK